jgi:MFS family permease
VQVILLASILIIVQNFSLGYLELVKDPDTFLYLSFAAQTLGGIGAGAISTSTMSILSSFKKDEREKYIGLMEAVVGLGFLAGPIMGSFLYTLGGFSTPFLFQASVFLVSYPFISYSLVKSNKETEPFLASIGSAEDWREPIPLLQLFMIPRFVFGLLTQMNLMMTLQYLAPTLAIHLHDFGYS